MPKNADYKACPTCGNVTAKIPEAVLKQAPNVAAPFNSIGEKHDFDENFGAGQRGAAGQKAKEMTAPKKKAKGIGEGW